MRTISSWPSVFGGCCLFENLPEKKIQFNRYVSDISTRREKEITRCTNTEYTRKQIESGIGKKIQIQIKSNPSRRSRRPIFDPKNYRASPRPGGKKGKEKNISVLIIMRFEKTNFFLNHRDLFLCHQEVGQRVRRVVPAKRDRKV